MTTYQRVLVPVDFSDCTPRVVQTAAELAAPHGAEVVLLHALEVPRGLDARATVQGADGPFLARDALHAEAEARLSSLLDFARDVGVSVSSRIVEGAPAAATLAQAELLSADLIVLGTHGRSGLRRLVLGSVSEEVMRHADVPVLTVRGQHNAGCEASSCQSCTSGRLGALLQAEAELDG